LRIHRARCFIHWASPQAWVLVKTREAFAGGTSVAKAIGSAFSRHRRLPEYREL
jgi:hypothetical protein